MTDKMVLLTRSGFSCTSLYIPPPHIVLSLTASPLTPQQPPLSPKCNSSRDPTVKCAFQREVLAHKDPPTPSPGPGQALLTGSLRGAGGDCLSH